MSLHIDSYITVQFGVRDLLGNHLGLRFFAHFSSLSKGPAKYIRRWKLIHLYISQALFPPTEERMSEDLDGWADHQGPPQDMELGLGPLLWSALWRDVWPCEPLFLRLWKGGGGWRVQAAPCRDLRWKFLVCQGYLGRINGVHGIHYSWEASEAM